MLSLLSHLSQSWMDGTVRTLEGLRRGLSEPFPLHEDPPPTTPYEVVYEGGKVRLRHYRAAGTPRSTPLLVVYSLIKRPFILDLQPGRSVIETLTKQGFEVYLIDWIPPTRADSWRGFDAYVNSDLANSVRAIQIREDVERVSLLGYCFGGLLTTIYTALHPETVKNLITFTLPLDMGTRELAIDVLAATISPETVNLITAIYGNCPAWFIKAGFDATAPVHHLLDKYVGLYRNKDREGYAEMFELFERWMSSDVPLAGQIFREMIELLRKNLLVQGRFQVGGQTANLQNITCSVLNVIAEHDDIVHPKSSLPLVDLIGSDDARNLIFPTGHIGAAVSAAAQKQLWPQVGAWLAERDGQWSH
ncbi:MAG: alpha/beta fold hydrolase [Thermodesulfobacteriota bacterium]